MNTEDISGVKAGTYRLTVTDANSCTGTVTTNVSQPLQLFAIVASYQNVLCSGDSSGYVDISVSGGTPPYNFEWNTGANTEDITKLVDGVYTITVADNNGCSISVTKQLTQPAALQVTSNATNAVCFGGAGSIDVTTTGGAQPYKFVWSNGATTEDLQSVSAGAYILTVTDNNNCSKQVVTTVSSATAISIAGVVTNTSCTGGNIGAVDISVTGGSGNYTYQWSSNAGSATSQDVTGLSAGIYTVTVTDASLCTQVASFEVVATSNQIIADLAEVNPVCSDGNNGFITVFVTGGTAPYIYIWSNGQTKNTTSNLTSGTYTVTITDAKGCSTTSNGVIVEPQPIDISVLTTGSKCSNIGSGAVNVSVLGGKAPFTYQLNGVVQSSNEFGNLLPGNYTIMVRDANGCEAVTSITIEQSSVYSVSLSADKILILSGMESQLTAKVISDAPVLNYFWSPLGSLSYEGCGDTLNCPNPKVAPSVTTIYTVTVLNADSCITSDTIFIAVSNQPSTFFPTAFTPNGDGLNDRFEFDILGAKSADVSIYNRWGNLVFASPDQPNGISNKDGWDGSFKGKLLEYDTYVYSIVVGYFDGAEKRFTGTVALMK